MKIGTSDISKAYIGTSEADKIYLGSNLVYQKGSPSPSYYNVGEPSFVMRFDGSWDYYSDGTFTASLVNSPSLTTGGPFNEGALAPTYDANDVTNRIYVKLSRATAWTNEAIFIEFWMKLENTSGSSIWQTFIGNMTKSASNSYNGFAFRWTPSSSIQSLDLVYRLGSGSGFNRFCNDTISLNNWTDFRANIPFGQWAHYGFYFSGPSYVLENGRCYQADISTGSSTYTKTWPKDIYLGNATYNNDGQTLSPMGEVRILLGAKAEAYLSAIRKSQISGTSHIYKYTIPTGPFSDGGLTKYTAQ